MVAVPRGRPGIGLEVDEDLVRAHTLRSRTLAATEEDARA
jgi:hypothetical protein